VLTRNVLSRSTEIKVHIERVVIDEGVRSYADKKILQSFLRLATVVTYHFHSALWIPMATSQNNFKEIIVVAIVEIGILMQQFTQLLE
jgi:hypothetical protein